MEVLVHRHHQEEASTSYSREGFSYPYFTRENKDEEGVRFHEFTEEKKRVFRFQKMHSIRDRGRSRPFTSLARKLGRFRVRYVLVQEPPKLQNDNH
ncbi:hypothetical protein QN277_026458 [Acacia crassicarpa]|uniref:Uncharacterized protein n=1 Tax=Acacia crassicarpa TaxID=499986 RepID=A0AAE1K6N3_9FABA|nr:hypothetical protein QN277_026458 [Acacia crassicarpa]